MEYKVALLLKEHYKQQLQKWYQEIPSNVHVEFVPYEDFKELEERFSILQEQMDGIYVSGIMPYQALRILRKQSEAVSLAYSPIDMENTYQILLQKIVTSKVLSLSRVGMDFLRGNADLEELIATGKFAEAVHQYEEKWEKMTSVSEIEREEKNINQYYIEECKKNKFDVIITYFYSVVETLKEYDVECFYVYPSVQAFSQILDGLKKNISLRLMKNKMPVVVHIENEGGESSGKEIKASMEIFNQSHFNQMIEKEGYQDLEYISDYDFLWKLTNGFAYCPIGDWLRSKTEFKGTIGYGIGNNLYQARLNAIDASRYGRNIHKKDLSSILIDEKEGIYVLKTNTDEKQIISSESYISEIADKVKLSSETILKIVGVMQALKTEEITSQELMDAFQISLRTANKFLSNLEKSGYAEIVGKKRNGNKGRPINIYRIKINT